MPVRSGTEHYRHRERITAETKLRDFILVEMPSPFTIADIMENYPDAKLVTVRKVVRELYEMHDLITVPGPGKAIHYALPNATNFPSLRYPGGKIRPFTVLPENIYKAWLLDLPFYNSLLATLDRVPDIVMDHMTAIVEIIEYNLETHAGLSQARKDYLDIIKVLEQWADMFRSLVQDNSLLSPGVIKTFTSDRDFDIEELKKHITAIKQTPEYGYLRDVTAERQQLREINKENNHE